MPDPSYSDLKSPAYMAKMYEDAVIALDTTPIQSYTLPTGVSVTRADLGRLRESAQYWRKMAHRSEFGLTTIAVQSGPF